MTASKLSRGDVVLVPFPFTDLAGSALRPALVISPGPIGRDVILAAISSVVRGESYATDYQVPRAHDEFATTGLRVTSVVRLHKLVTVEQGIVIRRLGRFGPRLLAEVDRRLRAALEL